MRYFVPFAHKCAGRGRFAAVSVAWTTDRACAPMAYEARGAEAAMKNSAQSRRRSLECLRLESDCKQLAGSLGDLALRSHFTRMALVWNGLAHAGSDEPAAPDAPAAKMCAA